MKRVTHCMSPEVVVVSSVATLDKAAQTMVERRVGSAVITDNDALRGIITERDLMRAMANGLVPWSTLVSDVMTPDPLTVSPSTPADEALAIMLDKGFRHLPVLEDGRICGIVSLRDLAFERTSQLLDSVTLASPSK